MPLPQLVVGRSGGVPAILAVGSAYTDDGVAYGFSARSRPFIPAGIGGEAVFVTLYVTTRHTTGGANITVTPYVDGVALESQTITLVGVPGSQGEQRTHELPLSVPYLDGGVEQMRTAPRGDRIEVAVASASSVAHFVEGVEVEYEIVRESKVRA